MASSLGELFIELGVFADTKELKQFEEKLKKVNDTMKKTQDESEKTTKSTKGFLKEIRNIGLAITGAVYALSKLTNSLIQNNQEFLNLTRNSDIALGTFQKWNNIGRMFGVKNAAQQLASLNQRLFELKLTGQGADGFILAGINPLGASAEGVMEQLRNRVAGLDDTAATFLLMRMGLDPSMLHLLRLSRQEFEAFNQATKNFRLTEEESKQLQMMNAQIEIAQIKIQYLKDRAVLAIMPYLVKFAEVIAEIGARIKQFVDWLNGNTGFAKFLKFIIQAVGIFVVWIATINSLAKTFEVLTAMITGARIALMALSAHPIIAALTALAGVTMWAVGKYKEQYGATPGFLPNMSRMNQGIDNSRNLSTINNNNANITMNNTINTTETAQALQNELTYSRYYAYGFAG